MHIVLRNDEVGYNYLNKEIIASVFWYVYVRSSCPVIHIVIVIKYFNNQHYFCRHLACAFLILMVWLHTMCCSWWQNPGWHPDY